MTSQETRNTLKFTKMCRYWRSNRCHMGQQCNFAHSVGELRQAPSLKATQLCFEFRVKGQCNKAASCTFAHGKDELRPMPEEAIKPKARSPRDDTKPIQVQRGSDPPKMQLLQMKMRQLEALYLSLDQLDRLSFPPPPGLEEVRPVRRGMGCNAETNSIVFAPFPNPHVDEFSRELCSHMSHRDETFRL
mmetsp:Transcript_55307/g.67760  ORF Transcript_55307/g.67760 Transcript_55307/m.67760 type:complete len:189 (+) Transcript_55307:54-620(+)